MLVVDTSAILAALLSASVMPDLVGRLGSDGDLHAPHLIDVELIHALRRLVHLRRLTLERASDVRADLADLSIVRYPHHPFADRMWELRDILTAYDAAFVTLSEALGVPLVTCDTRLARTKGHGSTIELFEPGTIG